MKKLTKMTASLVVAAGLIASAAPAAHAADNGPGFATVSWNASAGWCQLNLAQGSRAEAQVRELKRIYIKHFTDANTQMRKIVATKLGVDSAAINNRQYSDADAAKIGMTKAQLKVLHDRLNRKGAVEFIVPTGASFYGYDDRQPDTAGQVKAIKKDREERLGRAVYWLTNDAGLVQYVPPKNVAKFYKDNLVDVYAQVLKDKQRGAELSNDAVKKCIQSRHNGGKKYNVTIGLADEIHKYNAGWVNPPTLQMKAAEEAKKKKDDDSKPVPVPIPDPKRNDTPSRPAPRPAPRPTPKPTPKPKPAPAPKPKRECTKEEELLIEAYVEDMKIGKLSSFDMPDCRQRTRRGRGGPGGPLPVSLTGEEYTVEGAVTLDDGRVVYTGDAGEQGHNGGDNGSLDDSGSSGLFGSS